MNDKVQATVNNDSNGCEVQLWVRDPDLVGKKAKLKIQHHAKVKRSDPVHASTVLAERDFTLAPGQNRVPLGDILDGVFAYRGEKLDLEVKANIEIDDGLIFDTKLDLDLSSNCPMPERSAVPGEHRDVHSPRDRFSFIANLRAIPAKARLIVIWLMIVGVPVVLANLALGVRDEFVPNSQVWFYDHRGSDGDSESPIMKALMGSGGVGMAIWLAIRRQLKRYMDFDAKAPPIKVERGARCRASDMIAGKARVPLQHATVRVVAYNREHGQYRATEGSGKNRRTVTKSFTSEARGVVLYEQPLAFVPAETALSGYLDGDIDFTPMFDALYPPFKIGANHGLSLQLEAQLIHPEFVDHDIELDPGKLDPKQFMRS